MTNLPDRRTSFVGRVRSWRRSRGALAEARLVTLMGAGGCGKTSLAVEAAAALGDGLLRRCPAIRILATSRQALGSRASGLCRSLRSVFLSRKPTR